MSSASSAAPPPPPAPAPEAAERKKKLQVITLIASATWMGAVVDEALRRPMRSRLRDFWPDVATDADVAPAIAVRRRSWLGAYEVAGVAAQGDQVVGACDEDNGAAMVVVAGAQRVLEVHVAMAPAPLLAARIVPVAMPTVVVHEGDVDSLLKKLTAGRPCLSVGHFDGEVMFKEDVKLTLPKRASPDVRGFPCADAVSMVAAAERFVTSLSTPTRDTIAELPVPFQHPSLAMMPMSPGYALSSMMRLGSWLDDESAARTIPTDAVVSFSRRDTGEPIAATVSLRANTGASVDVNLAIFAGTCFLNGVPLRWYVSKDAWPEPTKDEQTQWVRTDAGWKEAGAWTKFKSWLSK